METKNYATEINQESVGKLVQYHEKRCWVRESRVINEAWGGCARVHEGWRARADEHGVA